MDKKTEANVEYWKQIAKKVDYVLFKIDEIGYDHLKLKFGDEFGILRSFISILKHIGDGEIHENVPMNISFTRVFYESKKNYPSSKIKIHPNKCHPKYSDTKSKHRKHKKCLVGFEEFPIEYLRLLINLCNLSFELIPYFKKINFTHKSNLKKRHQKLTKFYNKCKKQLDLLVEKDDKTKIFQVLGSKLPLEIVQEITSYNYTSPLVYF